MSDPYKTLVDAAKPICACDETHMYPNGVKVAYDEISSIIVERSAGVFNAERGSSVNGLRFFTDKGYFHLSKSPFDRLGLNRNINLAYKSLFHLVSFMSLPKRARIAAERLCGPDGVNFGTFNLKFDGEFSIKGISYGSISNNVRFLVDHRSSMIHAFRDTKIADFSLGIDEDCLFYVLKAYFGVQWDNIEVYENDFASIIKNIALLISAFDPCFSQEPTDQLKQLDILLPGIGDLERKLAIRSKNVDALEPRKSAAALAMRVVATSGHEYVEAIFSGYCRAAVSQRQTFSEEMARFIQQVAVAFEISPAAFKAIVEENIGKIGKAHFNQMPNVQAELSIFGLSPETANWETVTLHYRSIIKHSHPDKVMANGGSPLDIKIATNRIQDYNAAFEVLKKHWTTYGAFS